MTSRILLVDDDPASRRVYEFGIAREMDGVQVVGDGYAALDVVRRQRTAVVVADERMPAMSGVQLLRRVRAESPCTIGVLATAYEITPAIESALADGTASGVLVKPVEPDELREAIEAAAERHREKIENRGGPCAMCEAKCDECPESASDDVLAAADRMEAAVARAEAAAARLVR